MTGLLLRKPLRAAKCSSLKQKRQPIKSCFAERNTKYVFCCCCCCYFTVFSIAMQNTKYGKCLEVQKRNCTTNQHLILLHEWILLHLLYRSLLINSKQSFKSHDMRHT